MKKMTITYVAIAIALCAIWFFAAYVPYHKEQELTSTNITEAEKQLADFHRTISELPQYIEKQNNLLSLRHDLNSKLYSKKDVLKLFETLRDEAALKHVDITEITPPIEELLYLNAIIPDSSQPQFLNIGLNLEGDYISFGKFIERIEHAEYFQGINRCKMFGHADDKTKVTMHFSFKALLGNLRDEG